MMSRLAPLACATLLSTTAAACGSGDGDEPAPGEWTPTPEEAIAAVRDWQGKALKACSLEAIFSELPPQQTPAIEGYDAAVVRTQSDPNLVWTAGDARLLISALPALDDPGHIYTQSIARSRPDGSRFDAEIDYDSGRCTVTLDGSVVYDESLHTLQIGGIVRPGALAEPAAIAVIARDDAPDELAPARGAQLLDVTGVADAVGAALLSPALRDDPDAWTAAVAPLLQITEDQARALTAPGTSPFYREVLLPRGSALPAMTLVVETPRRRGTVLVSDAQLATLRAESELRLLWPYGGSSSLEAAGSGKTTDLEVTLRRTGDLAYELVAITPRGLEDRSDARAAACVLDRVTRLQTLSAAVPAGSFGDDVAPCANLAPDLLPAIANDRATATALLAFLGDAYRAEASATEPDLLPPSDGGPGYDLLRWGASLAQLVVALEPEDRGVLTASPSRIVDGFLASVRELDGALLRPAARRALVAAAASRALAAAAPRANAATDYRPLTATHATRLASALRSDELGDVLADDIAGLVRSRSLEGIDRSAALACLGGSALDGVRAKVAALGRGSHAPEDPLATWQRNVLNALLGWSYTTADAGDIGGTYCKAAFVTWAETQLTAQRPVCVYEGVRFDSNGYCAR